MKPTANQRPETPAELAPRITRRKLLDLLGLAARAGGIVTGIESVRGAAREDRVFRVILAEDAAPGQQQKLTPLLEARRVPYHMHFTRSELGAAVGRGDVSAIGITDRGLGGRAGELASQLSGVAFVPSRENPLGSTHDGGM